MQTRLQRILATAGVASRRQAEQLILDGRVAVNGYVVKILGAKADPDEDRITLDGRPVEVRRPKMLVLLHKPALVMTTKHDPQGRTTVMDLLPPDLQHLNPVGRLDYETSGLLLMTNDGDLAQTLTHPRHEVPKIYHALLRGQPTGDALKLLASGIQLEEGLTAPADVRRLKVQGPDTWVAITLRQGWNRQVRRMCEAVGHPVRQLKRVAFGSLNLGKMAPGDYRILDGSEGVRLRQASLPPPPTPQERAPASRQGAAQSRGRTGSGKQGPSAPKGRSRF